MECANVLVAMAGMALIVGNGFTLDLRAAFLSDHQSLAAWDPREPLASAVLADNETSFPNLCAAARQLLAVSPFLHGYALVNALLEWSRTPASSQRESYDADLVLSELRHLLYRLFRQYQVQLDVCPLGQWSWARWLAMVHPRLRIVVSFNYDLVLEHALMAVGVQYHRFGIRTESSGVSILKPHGSLDFDCRQGLLKFEGGIGYPLKAVVENCDFPIERVAYDAPNYVPTQAALVVPTEYSRSTGWQWVAPGYHKFRTHIGPKLDACVFIGLSYSKSDRDELDLVLDSLGAKTEVVIANPDPPLEFSNVVERRFRRVRYWKAGPEY